VALVQRAHRGHESHGTPFRSRLARHLLHPFYGVDGFQVVRVFARIQARAAAACSR
jgi:hypothetical protein